MPFQYEENGGGKPFRAWLTLILFCAVIVVWGLMNYRLIPDVPRRWDLGALPDVPGQSIYSTAAPAAGTAVPLQIAPLPEGIPLNSNAVAR